MSEDGQRIEFTDAGPYVFPVLTDEPEATLLEEHDVVVLRFGDLYFPLSPEGVKAVIHALLELGTAESEPGTSDDFVAVEFPPGQVMEMPLITGAAEHAAQFEDLVYIGVEFGTTRGLLRMSILTAGMVGQILSCIPPEGEKN